MTESFNMGVLTIKMGDDSIDLHCTPNAVFKLSRAYGGIAPLFQKIQSMDIEAYIAIIRAGSNLSDKDSSGLAEKVVSAGLIQLMNPLVEYLTLLCAGGSKPKEVETEAPGKP